MEQLAHALPPSAPRLLRSDASPPAAAESSEAGGRLDPLAPTARRVRHLLRSVNPEGGSTATSQLPQSIRDPEGAILTFISGY